VGVEAGVEAEVEGSIYQRDLVDFSKLPILRELVSLVETLYFYHFVEPPPSAVLT